MRAFSSLILNPILVRRRRHREFGPTAQRWSQLIGSQRIRLKQRRIRTENKIESNLRALLQTCPNRKSASYLPQPNCTSSGLIAMHIHGQLFFFAAYRSAQTQSNVLSTIRLALLQSRLLLRQSAEIVTLSMSSPTSAALLFAQPNQSPPLLAESTYLGKINSIMVLFAGRRGAIVCIFRFERKASINIPTPNTSKVNKSLLNYAGALQRQTELFYYANLSPYTLASMADNTETQRITSEVCHSRKISSI